MEETKKRGGRKRVFEDHAMTAAERVRRSQDHLASIDEEIDKALTEIDWDRRNKAEESFWNWVNTYGCPSMLNTLPCRNAKLVLDKMEASLDISKPQNIMLARGSGKSSFAQLFILFQIATCRRRYPVIISANARASAQLLTDIFRFILETDTPFAQDYPTLHLPHAICNGSYRRRQMYKGKPTCISKTAADLSFADFNLDGQPRQCHISARSITGGLRGMRKGNVRVDSVLLDDILGDEDATEETAIKYLDIINKSVLNLAGFGQKLGCLMTSTPIGADDITQKILADRNWSTVKYPAITVWGEIDTPEWSKYWDMYDAESIEDMPHKESDEFYQKNQEKLEAGFKLYNPDCYNPADNVSGVQSLMQKRRLIGTDAFECEYQLCPKKLKLQAEITPQDVLAKIGSTGMLEIPDGTQIVVSSWDLNVSHCITNSIVAFDQNLGATLIYSEVYKCRVPSSLPEQEYNQLVYNVLTKYANKVKGLGIRIDYLAIDGGGANFNVVCDWARNSVKLCGIRACAFVGRASHMWNENVRSKLRSASGRTVLCGDEREHIKTGTGRKWVAWDADRGKEAVIKAVKMSPYGTSGLMLFNGTPRQHQEFAQQLTNEKLLYIQHQSNGKDVYKWKSKSAIDHDYLDTMAQAYAVAWSNQIGTDTVTRPTGTQSVRPKTIPRRRRIRIV